ncbi:MAG TPA: glycosyltransferase family 2 protein [Parvularculaceae bacterium]|nr:glycosyltransferase family 2 protein [Amphiplicatus sp.]HPE31622.1 glycosyltransferase family 2 protein [Parvularculaceae bacterium]HRX39472.1 glycosyltransferase family 2 protein [Parvularculaceae bacterium]
MNASTAPIEPPALRAPVARGPELSVIIPTFNESENVDPLIEKLSAALSGIHWEAIFVDDDSPDGTARLIRERALQDSRIRVIHRIGRKGLSSAVIEGMLAASAPYLAVIDGDLQHDEGLLPQMLQTAKQEGCDLVIGSRYVQGGGVGDWAEGRRAASRFATRISRFVLPADISDPMSGFFLISRPAFDESARKLSGVGFKILFDIVSAAPRKLAIRELPYEFRQRQAGESKLDASVLLEFAMMMLDRKFGRFVPARFILFSAIGGLGLFVHLTALWMGLNLFDFPFMGAQAFATFVAMTSNYALNNAITFRFQRRTGWRFLTGLLSFYAVCSVGAVANVGIAQVIYSNAAAWWVSGVAGALVGSVWNYAVSSIYTWRK